MDHNRRPNDLVASGSREEVTVGERSAEQPAFQLWGKSRGLEHAYPLAGHLIDTAAAARVICERMIPTSLIDVVARHTTGGNGDTWVNATTTLAGWHDIGKATCGFQARDPNACAPWLDGHHDVGDTRHDRAGSYLIWDRLRAAGHGDVTTAAQIVGGHHGSIPRLNHRWLTARGGSGMIDHNPPRDLISARDDLLEIVEECAGSYPRDLVMEPLAASASLAVVVLADWLVSQDWLIRAQQQAWELTEPTTWHSLDPRAHYAKARELAIRAIDEAGLLAPRRNLRQPRPSDLIPVPIDGPEPALRELQSSIDTCLSPSGPGITVICAPTGEGKTEAALIAAAKYGRATGRQGFFFGMPTRATADGLHQRLSNYVRQLTADDGAVVRRIHSQAQLHDGQGGVSVSEDEQTAAAWMSGTRKALLAPWGVGTVDQMLLGAMRVKHSPLRLLGAATGTVVIDEAHALDPYMRELLVRAVEWLAAYGTSVVVLSATLPPKRVDELLRAYQDGAGIGDTTGERRSAGYPGWVAWSVEDGFASQTVQPRQEWALTVDRRDVPSTELTERIAAAAVSASADGGCVLLVRSTVRAAQDTYNAIRRLESDLVPGQNIDILHSRFPMAVRRDRTESLIRRFGPGDSESPPRPERFILVATQIVEQSLDLDFDLIISDPAPAAQVLQRAGRVHRHEAVPRPDRMREPRAIVFWPLRTGGQPSVSSPIYPIAELRATRQWLACEETVVAVPGDVPHIVATTDIETQFDDPAAFHIEDDDTAEATLAWIVAMDIARGSADNWRIPPPSDAYLAELTGSVDADDAACPGTRQGAHSAMIVPVIGDERGWRLPDGTPIPRDGQRPEGATVLRVFSAAIPVSYPAAWVDALDELGPAWRGTPLAGALMLPDTAGGTAVRDGEGVGWRLAVDSETGLRIEKVAA